MESITLGFMLSINSDLQGGIKIDVVVRDSSTIEPSDSSPFSNIRVMMIRQIFSDLSGQGQMPNNAIRAATFT